jgi:hypothetical protein
MQSDLWAAHDLLARNYDYRGDEGKLRRERREVLLDLHARLIKKLALSPDEIKALPDNYAAAVKKGLLPDVFNADGPWWEVRTFKDRLHDFLMDHRRVARVFVKPTDPPKDKLRFLSGLIEDKNIREKLDGAVLVIQDLLLDSDGKMVASPLTFQVQMQTFVKGKLPEDAPKSVAKQFDLCRRRLLSDPKSGGFEEFDEQAPTYRQSVGNNLSFASDMHPKPLPQNPILIRLGSHCVSCHGHHAAVSTFPMWLRKDEPAPPVEVLNPSDNEHARFVIEQKSKREDYKSLLERWK